MRIEIDSTSAGAEDHACARRKHLETLEFKIDEEIVADGHTLDDDRTRRRPHRVTCGRRHAKEAGTHGVGFEEHDTRRRRIEGDLDDVVSGNQLARGFGIRRGWLIGVRITRPAAPLIVGGRICFPVDFITGAACGVGIVTGRRPIRRV